VDILTGSTGKAAASYAAQELTKQTSQKAAEETFKKIGAKATEKAVQQMVTEASKKFGKEVAQKALSKSAEELVKSGGKRILLEGGKGSARHAATFVVHFNKEISKEVLKKSSVELLKGSSTFLFNGLKASGSVVMFPVKAVGMIRKHFLARVTLQPVAEISWLKRQHSINNIIAFFVRENIVHIQEWPSLHETTWVGLGKQVIRDAIPFHPRNEGLHTLFRQNQMIEA